MIHTGKKSQAKGRRAELELSRLLRGAGYDVRSGEALNYGREPDLVGLPGVHIECKRAEALRLSEWMAQARRDADRFRDGFPAIFHRRNQEPWRVTMDLDNWLTIYKTYAEKENTSCSI